MPLGDIKVTATGAYDGLRFSAIRLVVHADLPRTEADALLSDARRVCYVSNTLTKTVEIDIALSAPA